MHDELKKIPLWGWIAIGAVGLGLMVAFVKSRSNASSNASTAAGTYGSLAPTPNGLDGTSTQGYYNAQALQQMGQLLQGVTETDAALSAQVQGLQDTVGKLAASQGTTTTGAQAGQGSLSTVYAHALGSTWVNPDPSWSAGRGEIYYVTQSGEYLNEVAAKFNLSPSQLLAISPSFQQTKYPTPGTSVYIGSQAMGVGH